MTSKWIIAGTLAILLQSTYSQTDCRCVPRKDCNPTSHLKDNSPLPDGIQECFGGWVCCEEEQIYQRRSGCGLQFLDENDFKIYSSYSEMSDPLEFPWMILIKEKEVVEGYVADVYKGGGSLIDPQVVLTAAHVIDGVDPEGLTVRAGDWDILLQNEHLPHQEVGVSKILVHEKFNRSSLQFDVGLLVLSSPFSLTDNVNIVCLPESNLTVLSEDCFVSGWGRNSSEENAVNLKVLRKVQMPIIPREDCVTRLRALEEAADFQLHKTFMCAGGRIGEDTCKGDGGSPLVCPISGTDSPVYQQVGIVAWGLSGLECGQGYPSGFIDVSFFRTWIDNQMSRLGFATRYDHV